MTTLEPVNGVRRSPAPQAIISFSVSFREPTGWRWNRAASKATREKVEVTVSGVVRADMSMEVGDITQTIQVEATAPLLQTEDPNPARSSTGGPSRTCPRTGATS